MNGTRLSSFRAPSDAGRSASPVSDAGQASDDMKANGKGKAKAKGKKPCMCFHKILIAADPATDTDKKP
jgi:hypothetical protein